MKTYAEVITDEVRLPKGTVVEVLRYLSSVNQYYIKNIDSNYTCWAKPCDLFLVSEYSLGVLTKIATSVKVFIQRFLKVA